MPSISIFIPAYNAAQHLSQTFGRIPETIWQSVRTVWVINDGSKDATSDVIDSLIQKYPKLRKINFPVNQGYGRVVKKGLSLIRDEGSDYAICLHADGQYPPESIPDLVRAAEEQNLDLVQGSRHAAGTAFAGGMPLYKVAAGHLLCSIENLVLSLAMSDYHSGFLCYSHRLLERLSIESLSDSFDIDLELIAASRRAGLRIGEIAIPTHYGDEVSYLNPVTYGLRVVRVLGKYVLRKYDRCIKEN